MRSPISIHRPAMDSCAVLGILIVLSVACYQSTAEITAGSVIFVDSSSHEHLRTSSSGQSVQANSLSMTEVGATILVLLGLSPPPILSSASSSKLNELLMPNPFARPRRVLMLEVSLAEDPKASFHIDSVIFNKAIKRDLISVSGSAEIQLPGSKEVAFTLLDEPNFGDTTITDKEIIEFARSIGGSYIINSSEPIFGELIIPLRSGHKLNLHMSKTADWKFVVGLMYIIDKATKVIEMQDDFSGSDSTVAELIGGCFDGIKALQEEYGSTDITSEAMDLLLTTISTVFDSLQAKHKGQIVAVILFNNVHSRRALEITFDSKPSSRWLEEIKNSSSSAVEYEVKLVRRTLAWFTGVLLLIATLIGVYLLVGMPLTRDTLLYSNVKLD